MFVSKSNSMVFTCSRCGYKTNEKGRYTAHINRKFPCKVKKNLTAGNEEDDMVDISKLQSDGEQQHTKKTTVDKSRNNKQQQHNKPSTSQNESTRSDSSEEDNVSSNTNNNDTNIDLNIRIDYNLLLRQDLGKVMIDLLNEPNNMDAFKDLYQIKVPISQIYEEYPYQKIISMFEDYITFMYARKTMKTYTSYDHKNSLSFAPALFQGIYLNAVIKSETASTSCLSQILRGARDEMNRNHNKDDEEEDDDIRSKE